MPHHKDFKCSDDSTTTTELHSNGKHDIDLVVGSQSTSTKY